jgi:hypothetical protein
MIKNEFLYLHPQIENNWIDIDNLIKIILLFVIEDDENKKKYFLDKNGLWSLALNSEYITFDGRSYENAEKFVDDIIDEYWTFEYGSKKSKDDKLIDDSEEEQNGKKL